MKSTTIFRVPTSHLNDHTINDIRKDLLGAAATTHAEELHLDLAGVHSVSSVGLSLVMLLRRRLTAAKRRLVLCNVNEEIGGVLRLTRLDTLLEVRAA